MPTRLVNIVMLAILTISAFLTKAFRCWANCKDPVRLFPPPAHSSNEMYIGLFDPVFIKAFWINDLIIPVLRSRSRPNDITLEKVRSPAGNASYTYLCTER